MIVAALVAALLAMAIAAPAQAAPNVAYAWGDNHRGQLGDGTHEGPEKCDGQYQTPCSVTPVSVSGLTGVTAIAGGDQHGLALLEDGKVMAWGDNSYGELGDSKGAFGEQSDIPVEVTGLTKKSRRLQAATVSALPCCKAAKS